MPSINKKKSIQVSLFFYSFLNAFKEIYTDYASSPVTGLEWPRGFQEVKVPRFHDNGTGWW
jgi:hypothetical protein